LKRVLRVLVPLVVLAGVILVWSDAVDPGDAVLVAAGLEALLFLVGAGALVLVVQRYRKERGVGLEPWRALEDGLSLVLPRSAARLVSKEPRLLISLFRWAFRRVKPSDDEFAYHERSLLRAIMPLIIVSAPMELVVVHVLALAFSPWWWLKWVLLFLGAYAILWLLGLYASLVALPHRLQEKGLRLHFGLMADGYIPYAEIEEVMRKDGKAPTPGDGLTYSRKEDALFLATDGKTDVTLRLRAPLSVRGFLKETEPASHIHLAVNEPARFVRDLRQRVEISVSESCGERSFVTDNAPVEGSIPGPKSSR